LVRLPQPGGRYEELRLDAGRRPRGDLRHHPLAPDARRRRAERGTAPLRRAARAGRGRRRSGRRVSRNSSRPPPCPVRLRGAARPGARGKAARLAGRGAAGGGWSGGMTPRSPRTIAAEVFETEAAAIRALSGQLDEAFDAAVERLAACSGRVICTGMGKSGHIMKKVAATLASTGTPSFFLHPAEAVHGDLGMIVE